MQEKLHASYKARIMAISVHATDISMFDEILVLCYVNRILIQRQLRFLILSNRSVLDADSKGMRAIKLLL